MKRWRVEWRPDGAWRTFRRVAIKADAVSLALHLARGGHQVRVCDTQKAGRFVRYA